MNQKKKNNNKVLRQSGANRFIHWGSALSIILLIITGLGQLPLYKRYNIAQLPGAEWLGSFFSTLHVHYLAAAFLIFVVSFHLFYHSLRKEYDFIPRKGDLKESYLIIKAMLTGKEEPPAEKYLAEQRLAYLFIGLNVLVLILTGIIKVIKNIEGTELPQLLITVSTHLHNLSTVLLIFGILAHLAAFLVKANRPLIKGMFTGYVDEEYAKHRHSLWYNRIFAKSQAGK